MTDLTIRMTRAIDWLVANYAAQPSLEDAARVADMEPTAFQKQFTAHVGLSPKRFVQVMTHTHARDLLCEGVSTLDAAYAAGLSGNGRLHDLFVSVEAATPGEVKARGAGMAITYGAATSPFGEFIIARTGRGVCYLGFRVDDSRTHVMQAIRDQWPHAQLVENNAAIVNDAAAVTSICEGRSHGHKLPLHLFGTNFQLQVWKALLRIPSRHYVSYEGIADAIGRPQSCRAVGNAVGANPICLLIPCHRVIQKSGVLGHYSSGPARKKALLGIECRANTGE
ncbi:MAG: methylated-DNA--[protein]-cysteine S-methyltransferase [Proteobacteria bacterium]|nr:methylated-DNA--[protein]-cysteine S-methyltransferase [Pseudomonadota bacterium]